MGRVACHRSFRPAPDSVSIASRGVASAVVDMVTTTQARVGRLLTDPDGPHVVMLLGAGASVSSGVPGAAQIAEMAAKWAYCREHGRAAEDPSVTRSDWLPWLREQQWYHAAQAVGKQYPAIVLLTARHVAAVEHHVLQRPYG
jgi:hypothetical protein